MNLVPSQVRQQLVKEQVDRRVISKLLVNTLANITPQREKEGNQAAVKVQGLAAPRKCCLGAQRHQELQHLLCRLDANSRVRRGRAGA